MPSAFFHPAAIDRFTQAGQHPGPPALPLGNKRDTMHLPLYVEPRDVTEAQKLIVHFGAEAGLEAAERAETSRNLGNHLAFCRWRQIERLVILLSLETSIGTIH